MKKIYLEFLRGISTVFILGWHMAFLAPTGHPTRLTAYWGTDALIMFFMLSGLVINLSESKKPKSTKAFLSNRFIRIYPQFIVGMLLAFVALYVTNTAFPSLKTIIGNFFMVSTMKDYMGYVVPSIQSNLPVWSLSFEVAFYVLFAFTIGRYQKKAILYWFILSLISIPLYFFRLERDVLTHIIAVFAFSSVWIVGYYIYQYRDYFYAEKYTVLFGLGILPLISRMQFSPNFYDPLKYFIFSIFAIPFFRYCLQLPPAGKKTKMIYLIIPHTIFVIAALTIRYMPLKNAIVYSTFPYVYMGVGYLIDVLKIKDRLINFISKSGAIMGKYSYSLYISHYTILFIFSKLIHNVLIYALVSLPIILIIAYGLESWFQPVVMKYFKKPKQPDTLAKGHDLRLPTVSVHAVSNT
ncbi:acyltransferase family protein [Mucilaginibacter sp. OK098]|uniref:acyltransferase family protein n=1 Tax=Mucilaginibacter sp. OK098 TaxID=1855297 RepID=UPI0009168351|nr:acyltransferase family protein [Mucilaginibacter sp. OK098]SHL88270.1 Peptidoglycan/LPS O-acetylase OafA/YrhL, contains acyltransferase and SGNH-hydrolase domains [Mucilaginibacter sp. OK098]